MNVAAVLWQTALTSMAEVRTIYTLRTFAASVVLRLGAMVVFFWMLASSLGSATYAGYVLLGNGVAVIAVETSQVTMTATLEQSRGTLPHIVASRARVGVVFLARGLHWVVTGLAASVLVLLLTMPLRGAEWTPVQIVAVLPLLVLVALSTYGFALVASAISVLYIKARGVVASVSFFVLATFTGVNVPVSTWPEWLQWGSAVLPMRWGLAAVRAAVDGRSIAHVVALALGEVAAGVGWLAFALVTMNRLTERGRITGMLDRTS
jgi:ABC-2 type transport system permease protein